MSIVEKIDKLFEETAVSIPPVVLKAAADLVGSHLKVKVPELKNPQALRDITRFGATVKDTKGIHAKLLKEPMYLLVFDFWAVDSALGFPGGFGVSVDLRWEYRRASNGFGVVRMFIDESGKVYKPDFDR